MQKTKNMCRSAGWAFQVVAVVICGILRQRHVRAWQDVFDTLLPPHGLPDEASERGGSSTEATVQSVRTQLFEVLCRAKRGLGSEQQAMPAGVVGKMWW